MPFSRFFLQAQTTKIMPTKLSMSGCLAGLGSVKDILRDIDFPTEALRSENSTETSDFSTEVSGETNETF
jgi:hypothetical protein